MGSPLGPALANLFMGFHEKDWLNTWKGFDHDVVKLKATLGKNEYPGKFIDNQIHKYLDNKDNTKVEIDESEKKIKYFKLPFIGSMSLYTQKKLNDVIKRFCKVENVKLVFTTCKLSSFFSLKDRVPFELQSFVVYKFVCNGCSAMYIGMTCSHLSTRIKQHLVTDKRSHIFKHLLNNEHCKRSCDNDNCFSILDRSSTKHDLYIKEGIHIKDFKPSLNGGYNAISYPSCYSHPYTVLLLGHYLVSIPPPTRFNNISLVVLSLILFYHFIYT